ncbi:Uma2 family endonuclease [Actinokineospora enzanensis]|uniref:Uma2 family endonuclease n=1 Tax=Actinokineospora enzanensis TaxID=155975 RepID=UPI000364E79F|nr:Uma2 family endonuclease [Actinokineospora enzanensis]
MAMPATQPGALPWHPRPWTLEEFSALPDDNGQRVELIDGALVVSPAPGGPHQRVLRRLTGGLDRAAPIDTEVMPGINVVLGPDRVLIPDVAVTTVPDSDAVFFDAADMLIVVEIISPSSRVYDKALKRVLFAEAGIPYYLLVDPAGGPVQATLFGLRAGAYEPVAASVDGRLRFSEPFPVDIELG